MRVGIALLCVAFAGVCPSYAAEQCGNLSNGYGPYDYRRDKAQLPVVEHNHFDAGVEKLIRGKSAYLGGDIDYTLRAFPNHHRALEAMRRLTEKLKTDRPPQANYTIACYYERAVRFRPDDGVVRMLYANFLAKRGHPETAIKHLEAAEKVLVPNANLYYNMGLVYADLKQYDKALEHAHRAYQLGFSLPGLRTKLERAGVWRDPPPVTAAQATKSGALANVESPSPDAARAESSAASDTAAKP